ncbi:MAG: heat-inducible transcription repressor HrcA [Anaerolineaceae bacterium]|nr:heat-inducible transcription repressor HrcA [Anaerolineaceae bacterium]
MDSLTDRQKIILTLLIREYVSSAQPVGSQLLVEKYHLDMSSATVRNELAVLTDMGYLSQPHTSAGRTPTENGYRFFVSRLLQDNELPLTTRRTISHQFYQMRQNVEQWLRLAASVLAQQSRGASLVTSPHPQRSHFKHLELVSTHGYQVLMVMVFMGGGIHQRLLTTEDMVNQENLSLAANKLTHLCTGYDVDGIAKVKPQLSAFEQNIADMVIEEMNRADSTITGEIFLDGLSNVMAEPEFIGTEEGQRALKVFEERSVLDDLITRTILSNNVAGVHVLIGGEGTWDILRDCSIVLARYGTPGITTGTLGVLGPMRMPYGHTISTVRFVADLLSDLVSDTLVE